MVRFFFCRVYLNFLHLQRNDLPKITDFKNYKQGNNSAQVTALRRIHFNFHNIIVLYKIYYIILPFAYPKCYKDDI